ncbi:MAG: TrbI/VirB10 family protein [bacterium]|nr:TrbI/VirB10 family protein [bacterium]
MASWKLRASDPEGALPTRRTAGLAAVVLALAAGLYMLLAPSSEQPDTTHSTPDPAVQENPEVTLDRAADAVAAAETLSQQGAAAAARRRLQEAQAERASGERQMLLAEQERQRLAEQQRLAQVPPGLQVSPAGLPPYPAAAAPLAPTPQQQLELEFELQQQRLAQQGLLSPAVALTIREPAAEDPAAREARPPASPIGEDAAPASGAAPTAAASPAPAPAQVPTSTPRPEVPDHEVIDEGTILEALMVTQIKGDFSGPVQALVATPLWSRDRQRELIPRGTRALGTAQSVAGWGASRLAVGFHRLILPDGQRVELEMPGLSQAGETGLRDQVNRHFLSTFGAAGAVGLLAGLSQAGAQRPTGFSPGDARWEAGARIGQAGEQIFQQFLNRMPTLTIRAGHRVRIYIATDIAVPRLEPSR